MGSRFCPRALASLVAPEHSGERRGLYVDLSCIMTQALPEADNFRENHAPRHTLVLKGAHDSLGPSTLTPTPRLRRHENTTTSHPRKCLRLVKLIETSSSFPTTEALARSTWRPRNKASYLHLAQSRRWLKPTTLDSACVYLCGNSLGACPKQSQVLIQEELGVWGKRYVRPADQSDLSRLKTDLQRR